MAKKIKRQDKVGRPEELRIEELPKRYADMKSFLENYWGRLGLELKQVRQPEDVRMILKRVPGIEWFIPFRAHAICLIADESTEASSKEIRDMRQKCKDAVAKEDHLWSEYHTTNDKAQPCRILPAYQRDTPIRDRISEVEKFARSGWTFCEKNSLVSQAGLLDVSQTSH